MKLFHVLSIITFCAILPFSSCSDSKKEERANEARQSLPEAPTTTAPAANSPLLNTDAAVTNNEPHYKCPDNCVGGVGSGAGPCPVCGKDLVHNQAYHTKTIPPSNTPNTPPAAEAEPAQNAAGVWHYTCAAGCAGGAGGAGNCATCGGPLTHNTAYHN